MLAGAVDAAYFVDDERLHITEGVVQAREDDFTPGKKALSLTIEAVEALLHGIPSKHAGANGVAPVGGVNGLGASAARVEKLTLKLSGTKLLGAVLAEHTPGVADFGAPGAQANGDTANGDAANGDAGDEPAAAAASGGASVVSKLLQTLEGSMGGEGDAPAAAVSVAAAEAAAGAALAALEAEAEVEVQADGEEEEAAEGDASEQSEQQQKPLGGYDTELEYLGACRAAEHARRRRVAC